MCAIANSPVFHIEVSLPWVIQQSLKRYDVFYLDVIFSLATHRQDWFFIFLEMQLISTVYKDFVLELVIFILYYFKTISSAIKINPIRLGKILAWPLIVYKIWSIYLFIF